MKCRISKVIKILKKGPGSGKNRITIFCVSKSFNFFKTFSFIESIKEFYAGLFPLSDDRVVNII